MDANKRYGFNHDLVREADFATIPQAKPLFVGIYRGIESFQGFLVREADFATIPQAKPLFVGIYRGIESFQGFLVREADFATIPQAKPLFVGIYRGIESFQGFLVREVDFATIPQYLDPQLPVFSSYFDQIMGYLGFQAPVPFSRRRCLERISWAQPSLCTAAHGLAARSRPAAPRLEAEPPRQGGVPQQLVPFLTASFLGGGFPY